jgi:hypothetical protein
VKFVPFTSLVFILLTFRANFAFILGLINLNRAFDGDVVAVELLPEKEWSSEAEIVLEDEGYDPGDTLVI